MLLGRLGFRDVDQVVTIITDIISYIGVFDLKNLQAKFADGWK